MLLMNIVLFLLLILFVGLGHSAYRSLLAKTSTLCHLSDSCCVVSLIHCIILRLLYIFTITHSKLPLGTSQATATSNKFHFFG